MADIGEPFSLCRIFQKDSLVGIEKHCQENHVILTFRDRGVLVYNLEDNKLIHSLPVQQRKEFACAVVQDPQSRKYIGILDKTKLCQWPEGSSDLNDCDEVQVDEPVVHIHVCSTPALEPVLVFQDGSASLLSQCTGKAGRMRGKPRRMSSTQRIAWSSVFSYNGVSVVGVVKGKDKKWILSMANVSTDQCVTHTRECELDSPSEGAELLCCCVQVSRHTLVSYWTDGSLQVTDIEPVLDLLLHSNSAEDVRIKSRCIHRIEVPSSSKMQQSSIREKLITHIEMENRFDKFAVKVLNSGKRVGHLPYVIADKPHPRFATKILGKKGMVAMTALDVTHICLCSNYKTDNGSLQYAFSMFNTKFGTRQAYRSLEKLTADQPISSTVAGSRGAEFMLRTTRYLCVGVNSCVAVCPYTVEESSLATALGKMASTAGLTKSDPTNALLCIPRLPMPDKDLTEWMNLTSSRQSNEQSILEKLTNPQQTSTLEEFSSELEKYLDSKHYKKDESACDKVKKTSIKAKDRYSKGKFFLSQHFVLSVLTRCVKESKFWPRESLSHLIQTQCIPGSSSAGLLQCLIEKNETKLILKCLKNVQGIPESSIVSCLQYVLSADGSVFGDEGKDKVQPPDTSAVEEKMSKDNLHSLENNTENSSKLSKCLFGDKRTDLLCHILGYPVNDVFIQDSVRHLTSESVTVLLRFLAHIVQFASRSSFAREESPLKYPLVVDWTGWLVDAHYTSLALMTDVHELLLDLHDSVQDQITLFQKLSRLDGFLMHYKNKQPLPKTERIGPYSVEMLEL